MWKILENNPRFETPPHAEHEICCECDESTGRAGIGDDSLYTEIEVGPYCWECFPEKDL